MTSVERFNILANTETWIDMTRKHYLLEFEIETYNIFHKDRAGRRGGGAASEIHSTMKIHSAILYIIMHVLMTKG